MKEIVETDALRNLGEMLLQIEIDADEWVGQSFSAKLQYLKKELSKNNRMDLLNVGSRLIEGIFGIIRANTSNKTVLSYIKLAETGIGLSKVSMVLNNAFVAKKVEVHTDNDDLAQFMGRSYGREIVTTSIDSTSEICKQLLQMSPKQQDKYNFHITKIEYLNPATNSRNSTPQSDGTSNISKTEVAYILAKFNKITIGIEMSYVMSRKKGAEPIAKDDGFSYITVAMRVSDIDDAVMYDSEFIPLQEVRRVIYGNYIDSIDIEKNYIKIDNDTLTAVPRVNISFDVNNINLGEMEQTMKAVLKAGKRRGYMIQGDPGTGKTVSIHKLMMSFPDTPVFWISADSISDTKRINNVFRILNSFPGSIFIFDDIDGNDLSEKSSLTTKFITAIDATNSSQFKGVIIMTINEPQRIHSSIKCRPERIDEVIHVANPTTIAEVTDVIQQRCRYLDTEMPEWASPDNPEYVSTATIITENQFTHAHIAGMITDLVDLYYGTDDYNCGTFRRLIERRVQSIINSKMVANTDGHIIVKKS